MCYITEWREYASIDYLAYATVLIIQNEILELFANIIFFSYTSSENK